MAGGRGEWELSARGQSSERPDYPGDGSASKIGITRMAFCSCVVMPRKARTPKDLSRNRQNYPTWSVCPHCKQLQQS